MPETDLTRRQSLVLFAAAALAPSCSARDSIGVGARDVSTGVAEIYTAALEHAGLQVSRRFGSSDADVQLTLLRDGLSAKSDRQTKTLEPARAVFGKCLAVANVAVEQYNLVTVSECAKMAPHLRLACDRAFLLDEVSGLPALRRTYGRCNFKAVTAYDGDGRYYALNRGDADIATAGKADAELAENGTSILEDDRHLWTRSTIVPAVRAAVLEAHPAIAVALDRVSAALTTYVLRVINMRIKLLDMDPQEVAQDFVRTGHL